MEDTPYKTTFSPKNLTDNLSAYAVENTFEITFSTTWQEELIYWNNLFLPSFGIELHNLQHVRLSNLFQNREALISLLDTLKEKRNVEVTGITMLRASGEPLYAKLNATLRVNDNETEFIQWVVLDITRQHESKTALTEMNQDLAKVNAQMEKFLYSTSHDLRSPLTTVLGLTHLMRMEQPTPSMLTYIDKIERV